MAIPRILVVSLGGTIAMTSEAGDGATPALDAASLVASVPGLGELARIEALPFRMVPGAQLGIEDLLDLAETLEEARGRFDGIVITQGTDTIEETAFALDLLLAPAAPVIVTGAMRYPDLAGADGPANLLAAVQVASAPTARDLGVLVVLADQVHAARFIGKRHTQSLTAFSSLVGPLGWVSEGETRILAAPVGRSLELGTAPRRQGARVALLTASLDDGEVFGTLDLSGLDGVVIAALGAGHLNAASADALAAVAERIPVLLTSRTGAGEGLRSTYGFPGSERDLLQRGLLSAGWLDGPKARILLTLLLRSGMDRDGIAAILDRYLRGETAPSRT